MIFSETFIENVRKSLELSVKKYSLSTFSDVTKNLSFNKNDKKMAKNINSAIALIISMDLVPFEIIEGKIGLKQENGFPPNFIKDLISVCNSLNCPVDRQIIALEMDSLSERTVELIDKAFDKNLIPNFTKKTGKIVRIK